MPETQNSSRTLRRIGAVFAGLLFVVIASIATDAVMHVSGIFPPIGSPMAHALFLIALVYRIIYGIGGGYITARLAPERPIAHALVLGVIGFVLSVAGASATWNSGFGPHWYPLALVVTAIPSTWLGGMLARKPDSAK